MRRDNVTCAGERALDVPAKLAARVRLFATRHDRKTHISWTYSTPTFQL